MMKRHVLPLRLSAVADDIVPPRPPVARIIMTGMVITLIGFGGFGAWAALAPLASAAMAPGIITVDSSRKTVQHLDGGIIAEILVREGDRVQAGQVLMRLDDLETGSTVALLESQFHALMAQEARLEAERDGQPEVRLLPSLIGRRGDSMAADILAGQERIFAGRRSSLAGREAVTRQQITQLEAQIAALTAQRTAGQRQIALVREESAGVEELVAKGLERKPRLLALQRQGAELEGMQGNLIHRITEAREAIAQAELEIISLKADRHSEVVAELYDVQNRRIEAEEKLKAAQMRRNPVR
jgi:HlyD family secretion protein